MWCLAAVTAATTYSDEVQATITNSNKKQHSSSMRIAPKRVDSDLQYIYIYIYVSYICSVTNVPFSDIPDILNKYFARSTWKIFTFPTLNAIFEKR